MSGLGMIGGISMVIRIIEASIKVYNSAQKDLNLSETFKAVEHQLPIILDTLQTCKNHLQQIEDNMPADVFETLEEIIDRCEEKARKLREIFEKVIPGENDGWKNRYLKAIRQLGKRNRVEELMVSITQEVQLIVNHNAVQSTSPERNAELNSIIKEMKSIESSLPEEESSIVTLNSGGGAQTNNINYGSGQQINNNAAVGTQTIHLGNMFNFKQIDDFSFQEFAGVHLASAPYIDPKLFIGRNYELDQMNELLKPGDKSREQRRLILSGLGGVGKTQLALAYVNRHRDDYQSIFWLNASSEATLKYSLRSMAERIFDTQETRNLEGDQILTHILRWLSDKQNTQWLLIFDNYNNPDRFVIEAYYPLATHGTIVVTTRRSDLVAGRNVLIRPLKNIDESLEILQTRSHREGAQSDPHAKRLAERLGGLPLALATAGVYLHKSSLSFERYLQQYEKCWSIDTRRPVQLQDYRDRTLYTTWDLSYAPLQSEYPDAAKLLKMLAYFDNQSFWYELFRAGVADDSPGWLHEVIADEFNFTRAMGTLTDYCFVEVQEITESKATKSWSMHKCVHDWTLAVLNKIIDAQQYWYAFDCVAASINEDDRDSLERFPYDCLAAHAARLVQDHFWRNNFIDDVAPDRLDKALEIAHLLASQHQFIAAEQMYLRVLTGSEKALGPEHGSTLNAVNNLGKLYKAQGKLAQAEQMYVRALAGKEKALGPDHTSTLDTVNNLGIVYADQGRLTWAEGMHLRALAGKEKALGPEHPSTLDTVNNMGNLYADQGKLLEAEQMYIRAQAGYEKVMGPEHSRTLNTVNNLGSLYRAQGKLAQAEHMYMRVLATSEKTLGPEHSSTVNTVNNLGILYADQGRLVEAETFYLRALAGKQRALGPEHTSTLTTINNLGNLYRDQGKLAQAERMHLRALAGKEKALGPEHISTLDTVNNLGILYADQGKLAQAEGMHLRALVGKEKALGPEHPSTLDTVNNLGILYADEGKLAQAERMHLRALAGREKVLGPEHTSTLDTINNLGSLFQSQGKLAEAEVFYLRALAGKEKALGPQHSSALDTVNNLGNLYADQGKLADAEVSYLRALAGYENALQFETVPALNVANNLGNLYMEQGGLDTAEQMYQRALAGRKKVLGSEHPSTLDTISSLKRLSQLREDNQGIHDDSISVMSTLIGSLNSETALAEAARNELQHLLMKDESSKIMLQVVVSFSTLAANDLAGILTNALRSFARDLRKEVNAPGGSAIREACKFLAENAARLAHSIVEASYNQSDTSKDVFSSLHNQSPDSGRNQLLSDYLTVKGSATVGKTGLSLADLETERRQIPSVMEDPETASTSSSSSSSATSELDEGHLPVLEAINDVFSQSNSYAKMKDALWQSIREYRYDWDTICSEWQKETKEPPPQELHDACAKDMDFLENEPSNILDTVKISLEAHTGQPWDWWPFQSPRKPILAGKMRLKWRCHCSELQLIDISSKLAEKVKNFIESDHIQRKNMLLPDLPEKQPSEQESNMTHLQDLPVHKFDPKTRYISGPASSAQDVPADSSPGRGLSGPNSLLHGQQGQNANSVGQGNQGPTSNAIVPVQKSTVQNQPTQSHLWPPSTTWVLLCVKNGSRLPHEQIDIPLDMTDNGFFRKFRLEYRRLRGWSYWYHPDKFYYCHVAKFIKWDVREMGYHCNQMPDSSSYVFQPKPPSQPYELPIPAREWEHRFTKDCSYSAAGFLSRIPKRVTRYELETCRNGREEIWGLYVMYRTSARVVLAWFTICLCPSLVFVVLLIRGYKTDLQDAIAPLSLTMATIPVLYILLDFRFKGDITLQ